MRESSTGPSVRSRKSLVLLAVAALAAIGLYFVLRGGPPRSDTDQIRELLTEGEWAVEEKDLSKIMGFLSKDFRIADLNRDQTRLAIAQVLREQGTIYVTLNDVSIQPQGETATASSNVTVEAQAKGSDQSASNTYPMTLQLRKEPGHRFLVIPTETWRVVAVEGVSIPGGLFE